MALPLLPRLASALLSPNAAAWRSMDVTPWAITELCQYATGPAGFVRASKPAKKRPGEGNSTPRQEAVIQMLLHHQDLPSKPQQALHQSKDDEVDAARRLEEYLQHKAERQQAYRRAANIRCQLQQEALKALPPELKAKAMQPDLTPFPPARKFFFDTPPAIYLEPETAPAAPSKNTTQDKQREGGGEAKAANS